VKRTAIILIICGILALSLTGTGCNEEEITSSPSPAQAALFLTVTQPSDGAQVSTSSILVVGTTNPGAVVSVLVNDKVTIADVDQNGAFSVAVSLEEGPNFIEVIASDQEGDEKSSTIAVIYIP
jgi:hypothetical protein